MSGNNEKAFNHFYEKFGNFHGRVNFPLFNLRTILSPWISLYYFRHAKISGFCTVIEGVRTSVPYYSIHVLFILVYNEGILRSCINKRCGGSSGKYVNSIIWSCKIKLVNCTRTYKMNRTYFEIRVNNEDKISLLLSCQSILNNRRHVLR